MNESEAYSAKAARAGKDIGKPGKNFDKIAAKAAKKYGSEERGKKVAGAILRNLRMKEDLAYLHTLEYLDQENIELESLSEEQINELLAGFRQRKVNRLEKKADQLERINKAKSRIRAAKRVSRQNSKVRKVGRAIGKTLFGSSAVRPKPVASARPRPVAKPAVKPVSSVKPKPKKLGEDSMKESLTYSKFAQFLRKEESEYINMGGARVKNDEKSVLQHIQKTFPNVKKVKKDPQHGWSPVFKEATSVTDYNPKSQGGTRKELLAKYAKTKDPKHAESARKAGASQSELKAARMEEVELDENYRVLATKGIGAERKEDIKVGHGVDYYHPKDGSKHMGKIHSMNDKGYVVRDDKTGEKHKFQYYRRMEEEVEQIDELSDTTLTNYAQKVHDDSLKHDKDPSKRSAVKQGVAEGKKKQKDDLDDTYNQQGTDDKGRNRKDREDDDDGTYHQRGTHDKGNKKRNKSVMGFSRALNKLESRPVKEEVEQIDEMDKSQPSSSRGAEGLPLGKKAEPIKTDKAKQDALKALQKQYKKVKEEVEQVDEMNKSGYSPGWMLKADPKLGKKVKDKITLAKLRQKAYGDPSAGKSVMTKEDAERVDEKAPPGKKYERMVKHIKKGYEGDGLTKQEKGIAYATAWKSYNKGR